MLKHYFSIKAQYPDALLLYRVGDFYESYGADGERLAKVLGIVQTRKANGEKGDVPMAGFPHHAMEGYLTKLVRAGCKVAVCDQLEDPKLVAGGKLVKRGVTELVTPGLAFGEQMTDHKENNFLVGLSFEKDRCGAAFLDATTGVFQVAQGSLDYMATLLASLSPKEIVVERGCEKGVRERFGDYYITGIDEWAFVYETAVQRLCKQLEATSLKGFGIEACPLGVVAAGALMVYLEQTHHSGLKNICSIGRIDEGSFVWMDKFTLRNLEVFAAAGGDGVSLVETIDGCRSPMGSRLLRRYLAMPVLDTAELNERYDVVQFFSEQADILHDTQEAIAEVGDMDRILGRAATGRIVPREVMQLGRGLDRIDPISRACAGKGCAALDRLLGDLADCSGLLGEIRRVMAPEPAAAIGKGPVIARGVSPELDELRDIHGSAREYLLAMQEREAERTGIASLKIGFNNVFGYYLEVRNTFKDKVPPEWIRKQTLVSAERYITEELKQFEEKILNAEGRILAIEAELYGELVSRIQQHIPDIQRNSRILARIDVLAAFGARAAANNYCRPVVDDSLVLDITAGRHPVIETLMPPGESYVPNDIHLDDRQQQVIILTGPNMAGKSALLRQTALIVLMAQIGSFVPATAAHFGYFDKLFTRVGASDNISRGESTFMVEMLETAMILHNLSARSLVLLDEIGRGTATYDGMSIARAIVEYIHEHGQGAKTLFATHYHELNDLEGLYPRVRNFHVAVKEVGREVLFLRLLKEGGTAHSFGIHVARMAGMPKEVLRSAEQTLKMLENHAEIEKTIRQSSRPVKPHNTREGRVQADGSIQLSMFQLDDPLLEALRDRLNEADLDNMTPLQAFDLLRTMKKELGL